MNQLTNNDYHTLFGTKTHYEHMEAMDKYNATMEPERQIKFTHRQSPNGSFIGVVTHRDELPEVLQKLLDVADAKRGFAGGVL